MITPSVRSQAVAYLLRKARELITPEAAWRKGYYAFTASGMSCDPQDAHAVCFCALGALQRVALEDIIRLSEAARVERYSLLSDCYDALDDVIDESDEYRGYNVPGFNDHPDTQHADVLGLYDRAIAKKEAA